VAAVFDLHYNSALALKEMHITSAQNTTGASVPSRIVRFFAKIATNFYMVHVSEKSSKRRVAAQRTGLWWTRKSCHIFVLMNVSNGDSAEL
jgi:hypothetical protein